MWPAFASGFADYAEFHTYGRLLRGGLGLPLIGCQAMFATLAKHSIFATSISTMSEIGFESLITPMVCSVWSWLGAKWYFG